MTCDEVRELLLSRAPLPWARQQALEAHLRGCAECARLRSDLRVTRRALAALPAPAIELDPATRAAIRQRLAARPLAARIFGAPSLGVALASLLVAILLLTSWPPRPAPAPSESAASPVAPPTAAASAPAPAAAADSALAGPLTILVIGTDSLVGDPAGRADSLLLVRLSENPHRATVAALPRQLWARYPDQQEGPLSTALAAGARAGGADGGAFVKEAVAGLLGAPIDHYLLMDMQGFVRLIDALGGVTVDIPEELVDPAFPINGGATVEMRFEPGPQVLSGGGALTYARSRNSDNDFGRDRRQLVLLRGIVADLQRRSILGKIKLIDDYRRLVEESIRTDLPPETLLAIARWTQGLDPAAVETVSFESQVRPLEPPATFELDEAARDRLRALLGGQGQP